VEWVEASGRSLTEAKEAVLDLLGVAEDDAEFVVLSEPRPGLFGRMRGEARVQARVRPTAPPPKRGARQRRGRSSGGGRGERRPGGAGEAQRAAAVASARPDGVASGGEQPEDRSLASGPSGNGRSGRGRSGTGRSGSGSGRTRRPERDGGAAEQGTPRATQAVADDGGPQKGGEMTEASLTLEQQGEAARTFLSGLLDAFGYEASLDVHVLDDETVEVRAHGENLGLLVGPRGATLAAVQDLTRTFVQRQSEARTDRILVDVAGYREKRTAALQRFTAGIVEEVVASGQERALEPMSPADRKVVHDTVNAVEGVRTRSEGVEPRRYIVIEPAR
jgi:spoIIIJ-associated protein